MERNNLRGMKSVWHGQPQDENMHRKTKQKKKAGCRSLKSVSENVTY